MTRLTWRAAQRLADEVIEMLGPGCEQVEVTGETRRRRPFVTKLEILAAPRLSAGRVDLWGVVHGREPVFDAVFDDLCRTDHSPLAYRLDDKGRKTWSVDYKRAWVYDTPLEIYMVNHPGEWGVAQALHTGPYAFAERLRRPASLTGLLPDGDTIDGRVYRDHAGRIIPMATESALFEHIGIEYVEPWLRRG